MKDEHPLRVLTRRAPSARTEVDSSRAEAGRSADFRLRNPATAPVDTAPVDTAPVEEQRVATLEEGAATGRGRVLVVAPQPFYEDRGTPIALRQVLEALTQIGYDVDLLTFPVGKDLQLPRVRLFRVSNPFRIRRVPIGFSLRKLALDASLAPALRKRLREERYVCVHAVEEAGFLAVLLTRNSDVPVIYDMQSSLAEQMMDTFPFRNRISARVIRRCEAWLFSRADFVVSSAGLADRVRAITPKTRVEEWAYVSNFHPVDPEEVRLLRRRLELPDEAKVVLYTGNFERYQGVPILLQAIPEVRRMMPEVTFVLVGDEGSGRDGAEATRSALQASGALRLVGREPRERMPAFLSMADVVVSPRIYGDNLPLKIFDYLASGRPIVATDTPTHRAVLDERTAVLVPPVSEAVAGALLDLLGNPELADRLGREGRRYAEEHLGWDGFVDSIETIYQKATTCTT